ncbi:MAG: tetraacyldisaccharide 4-kinase [Pyrinomonadaceae bacterium]|jgi:tetraacyldisaccharide 4'-kinase|nr:tetraacyldisaccharide 4-kinase [Pyrinomonadaceae bacterium]
MKTANSFILPPFSALYSLATRLRLAAYRRHLLSVSKLDAVVISVGNITTGGTGKTPLVEWVCRVLADEGKRVCVLTRGYRRQNPNEQVVVSDGNKIIAEVAAAGDEALLLARNLVGIAAVVCNSNRSEAGRWAINNLQSEVFVLDDGFQHLQLARDLNIVTIDATNPWGGGMLPSGHLREPLGGLGRADCVVLTRTEQTMELAAITAALQKIVGQTPVFRSRMVTTGLRRLGGETLDPVSSIQKPVAAFCGVGNPESFFNHLRREGFELAVERAFPDHYNYQQVDVDRMVADARGKGAGSILTTAKDAVKLSSFHFEVPCYVLEIKISIEDDAQLIQMIRNQLN